MQGHSKINVGPIIPSLYILVEASIQDYSNGSVGPFILVHYIG
jgi:hypothetical protein